MHTGIISVFYGFYMFPSRQKYGFIPRWMISLKVLKLFYLVSYLFNNNISINKASNVSSLPFLQTLHKKWSFPLRIFSVNMTKSVANFIHMLFQDFLMFNYVKMHEQNNNTSTCQNINLLFFFHCLCKERLCTDYYWRLQNLRHVTKLLKPSV